MVPRRRISAGFRSRQHPPLIAERVRSIGDHGFAFIPNRFLLDGFFAALEPDELRLYFLLTLAADRRGMSYYHYETLCALLRMPREHYVRARNCLLAKDLIAFDGTCFQVLELPIRVPCARGPLRSREQLESEDPATVRCLVEQSLRHAQHVQARSNFGGPMDGGDEDEER